MWLVIAVLNSKKSGAFGCQRESRDFSKSTFHNPLTLSRDADGTEKYMNVQNSDPE